MAPANKRLSDAAARLQVMQLSQYNAVGDADAPCEKVVTSVLECLHDSYDYIIDCGLKHELLTVNALAASDCCIVPVQAHFLASEGNPDVLELVKSVYRILSTARNSATRRARTAMRSSRGNTPAVCSATSRTV